MSTYLTPLVLFFPEEDRCQQLAARRKQRFVGHEIITCRDGYTDAINEHVSIIDGTASPMTQQDEQQNKDRFNPAQVKPNQSIYRFFANFLYFNDNNNNSL